MRIYSVINHKGGVGKTTTTASLGAAFAETGRRVLLVDLDPQAGLTSSVGCTVGEATSADVMREPECIERAIVNCTGKMRILPSSAALAIAMQEIVGTKDSAYRLRTALRRVEKHFDSILIDCPATMGAAITNGLAAAHIALVPMQCDYLSLRGLADVQAMLSVVRESANSRLHLRAIATFYDRRTTHAQEVLHEAREVLNGMFCHTTIPRSVRLAETPATGKTILEFAPSSQAARAYRELAQELIDAENNQAAEPLVPSEKNGGDSGLENRFAGEDQNTHGTTRRYSSSYS